MLKLQIMLRSRHKVDGIKWKGTWKGKKKIFVLVLSLLLPYISFKPNIQFHKTNKINDLASEMNYMINKKGHFRGSFSNQILCCELLQGKSFLIMHYLER